MKTCLVVPCYNEAQRFPQETFLSFLAQHSGLSVVLVNDGSSDATASMLRSVQAKAPEQVHVLDRAVRVMREHRELLVAAVENRVGGHQKSVTEP